MRVYYHNSADDFEGLRGLCSLFCSHPNVDLCDVEALPEPFGDLRGAQRIGKGKKKMFLIKRQRIFLSWCKSVSENDLLNILRKCCRHYEQTERPWHKRKVRKKYLLQFAGFGIKVVKW